MKAVLLAAGFGKRLGSLTKKTPKPLIEVQGKPLIDYHLEKLIKAGFNSVSINVHYMAEKIIDHVNKKFLGKIDINFSYEKEILGTGGGVLQAITKFADEDIVIINSDIFSDYDYQKFLQKKSNTLFVIQAKDNFLGDFTVKDGLVDIENSKDFVWTGFSVINRSVFNKITHTKFHYWHDCLKILASEKKLRAEILNINWYDVGSPETLNALNK